MPVTAADVIAATLRREGIPNPDITARAVAADLAGHSLLADSPAPRRGRRSSEPAPRCQRPVDPHSGTELVGGRCPICQWTPNT